MGLGMHLEPPVLGGVNMAVFRPVELGDPIAGEVLMAQHAVDLGHAHPGAMAVHAVGAFVLWRPTGMITGIAAD